MATTYPVPGVQNNNLFSYKTTVSASAAATTTLFTVPNSGKFYVTDVIVSDPSATVATATMSVGWTGSATVAAGVCPAITLAALTAAAADQYIQIKPGVQTATAGTGQPGVARAVAPGDNLTVTIASPVGGAVTVQVAVIGYFI